MRHLQHDLDRATPTGARHTHGFESSWISWRNGDGTPTTAALGVTMRCCYCGEQFPLGPANDDIPRRRAAEEESLNLDASVETLCEDIKAACERWGVK